MTYQVNEDLINRFTSIDYVIFIFLLGASILIGIYQGCFGKGVKDAKEFLLAGRSASILSVAMSLAASFISAIGLLGMPSEVYQYGMSFFLNFFGAATAMLASAYFFAPVYLNMELTSAFEYLEIRFSKPVRSLGSFIYMISTTLYISIAIYAPALALAQVTGIQVRTSVISLCVVVISYTTIGGMKAVLWTDVLQLSVMIGTILMIAIKGFLDLGGFQNVWQISDWGNRTHFFDPNPDPRTRHSIWSLLIGGFFYWLSVYAVNQTQVQRYMWLPGKRSIVKALLLCIVGYFILMSTGCLTGLIIFSKYAACDPMKSGLVGKADQLFPFFVMEHFGEWKGLPGVFVAGIFSGALSTASSGLNSLSAISLEDHLKALFPKRITEKNEAIISKILSVIFGLLLIFLSLLAEYMGNVLTASFVINGIINGPMLGLFSLGMFFPFTNSLGAILGTVGGVAITGWVTIGNLVYKKSGHIKPPKLPVIECSNFTIGTHWNGTFNASSMEGTLTKLSRSMSAQAPTPEENSFLMFMYSLSYLWSTFFGCFVTVLIGIVVSLLIGMKMKSKPVDPKLLSPLVLKLRKLSIKEEPSRTISNLD